MSAPAPFAGGHGRLASFRRLLASDVRYGLGAVAPRLGLVVAMTLLVTFMSAVVLLVHFPQAGHVTWGEAALLVWRGILPYSPALGEPFKFPMAWFALLVAVCYMAADYPFRDLGGMGAHLIVASRSRWAWWLAKCGWVVAVALACWLATLAVAAVVALASGGGLALGVRPAVAAVLNAGRSEVVNAAASLVASGGGAEAAAADATLAVWPAMLAALACLVAILLVQTVFSLLVHPVVGMVASVAVLFFSAYFRVWWLPGQYLMLARTDELMRAGFHPWAGALLALGIAAVAVAAGGLVFSRKDILGRDDDR